RARSPRLCPSPTLCRSVLLVVAAVVGYVFYLGSLWNDNANSLEDDAVFGGRQPVAEEGDGLNILLLGSDSRDEDVDYSGDARGKDRKSTRLNSSHVSIS